MENKKVEYKKGKTKLTQKRKVFNEKYQDYSDAEIQKEILYTNKVLIDKTERVRKNTSNLVTFLIVIPFILGLLYFIFTLGRYGKL